MALPALLFSFLLASIYGLAFYLLFGRGWLALGVYWFAALAGFAVGEFVSQTVGFSLIPIGSVNVIEASVMSFLVLFLTRTLWKK
jgi:hypothetical protein